MVYRKTVGHFLAFKLRLFKFLNEHRKSSRGYSLVELMFVVSTMSALAVIAVPTYRRFKVRAIQAEAKLDLAHLATAMEGFHSENGSYTTRLDAIGFEPTGVMKYSVGFTTDVPPPPGVNSIGNSTCLATGPGMPTCGFSPQWVLDPAASSIPGLPASTATINTYTGWALGKIDGINIDSWSISDKNDPTNVNPVGFN